MPVESTAQTFATRALKIGLALLVAGVVVVLIRLLWEDIFASYKLIEPFEVCEAVSKRGLTGAVVASQLRDELQEIKRRARIRKGATDYKTRPELDVEMSLHGITIKNVASPLRRLFGPPRRVISGEVFERNGNAYMVVRFGDDSLDELPFADPTNAVAQAAEVVLREVDPLMLVAYYFSDRRGPAEVIRQIQHCLYRGPPEDFPGAYASWSRVMYSMGDFDGADEKLGEALVTLTEADTVRSRRARTGLSLVYGMYGLLRRADDFKFAPIYTARGNVLLERWRLKKDRNLDDADKEYEKATKFNFAPAYIGRGYVMLETGKIDNAIDMFKQAIKADANFAEAYNDWGVALGRKSDQEKEEVKEKGYLNDAIKKYREAIQRNPMLAEVYSNWGYALQKKKDCDGALAMYQQATELDPKLADAWQHWADLLLKRGQFRKDKKDLDAAVEKFRKFSTAVENDRLQADSRRRDKLAYAYNYWADALMKMGELSLAVEWVRKAIAIKSDFHLAYCTLGEALVERAKSRKLEKDRRADLHAAEKNFNKTIELARNEDVPPEATDGLKKIKIMRTTGRHKNAEEFDKKASVLKPEDPCRVSQRLRP